jgi:hypothetical protein
VAILVRTLVAFRSRTRTVVIRSPEYTSMALTMSSSLEIGGFPNANAHQGLGYTSMDAPHLALLTSNFCSFETESTLSPVDHLHLMTILSKVQLCLRPLRDSGRNTRGHPNPILSSPSSSHGSLLTWKEDLLSSCAAPEFMRILILVSFPWIPGSHQCCGEHFIYRFCFAVYPGAALNMRERGR